MSKLISICTIEGCNYVFIVDRSKMKKPTDDPRIRHLQCDHKMKGQIRLEDHFKNIHKSDKVDLFVMVS